MPDHLDESFTTLSTRFAALHAAYSDFQRQPPTVESLQELDTAQLSLLQALEEFHLTMRPLHQPMLGGIAVEFLPDGQDGQQ